VTVAGFDDLITAGEALVTEDLTLAAGATWRVPWSVEDGGGNPIPFVTDGCTALCRVKDRPSGTTLLTFASSGSSDTTVTLSDDGVIALTALASYTKTLAIGNDLTGVYELEVVKGGEVAKIVRGHFTVRQEIATDG